MHNEWDSDEWVIFTDIAKCRGLQFTSKVFLKPEASDPKTSEINVLTLNAVADNK